MRRGSLVLALLSLAASAGAAFARPPVLVELFTAQGCVSCAAAEARIASLADAKGVIALTFSVDYWDYLGWKDTFARPEFADRQRAYDKRFDVAEVFTPQVVVDGRAQAAAVKADEIDQLVAGARHTEMDPPQMFWRGTRVGIGGGRRPRSGAGVWLVRYDPRTSQVEVKDGDNRGHTVGERNVVVQLERLGAWRGRPMLAPLPPAPAAGLRTLVLVQGDDGGKIMALLDEPAKPLTKSSVPKSKAPAAGGTAAGALGGQCVGWPDPRVQGGWGGCSGSGTNRLPDQPTIARSGPNRARAGPK